MERIDFMVTGSTGNPYEVIVEMRPNGVAMSCTCEAGKIGSYCKHRVQILNGELPGIVKGTAADLARVRQLIAGSPVDVAYRNVLQADHDCEAAKRQLKKAKDSLSKAMRG